MSNLRISETILRAATVADCAAIAKVHVQSWRGSFTGIVPQTFLDQMSVEKRAQAFERRFPDDSYKMYVAEVAERGIVGFADFGEAREMIAGYEGELYAIYLLPEFQRKGIGERLFKRGVEFLVGSGWNSMYLLALEVSPYKLFYEKMGGQVIGRKQVELGGVMFDELVYGWKNLRAASGSGA
ncbi:MAG TPA: GNAT family N-acetyltransferase [Pyrinomonadaceae bacterium]|nr:GNAT family N-acetyltransferase [Pyrinomonadaceae bacterium]